MKCTFRSRPALSHRMLRSRCGLGLLWISASLVASVTVAAEPRPCIILCMADDQGWGDMAYNGHPHVHTPVFDQMATTGLRLDQFYAAAPVCSPTRASVLTGRTPARSGVFSWGHSLRPEEVTVAEALQSAGYVTGHFGKWHLGSVLPDSPLSPGAQGFQEWFSAPNFFEINPWLSHRGRATQFTGEGSEVIVDLALQFARQHAAAQQPFLAVIWFGSPHAPHRGTPDDLALYADQPPKQRHFLAEITAMDRAMGKLRNGIRELGIADHTLLWFCSDNGAIPEGSTGGLRGRKGQLYEGGLRVPCLIEWPQRITAPRTSQLPCGTVDIYPTLLEVAGAAPQQQPVLDGQSLLPLFDGDVTERRQPLGFWETGIAGYRTPSDEILQFVAAQQQAGTAIPTDHAAHGLAPADHAWQTAPGSYQGHAAWRDGPWKLHRREPRNSESPVQWELYNLTADPQEQHNLAEQEPQRVAAMQQQLHAWLQSVTDSLRGQDYPAAAAVQ